MFDPYRIRGFEGGEGVGELAQGTAYLVVFGVVGGVGDGVAAADGGGVVVGVALIGCEIDLWGELIREGG